jgi:hypothetical protein
MRAQCAHLGRALSHQKVACAVEHEDALRFGRHLIGTKRMFGRVTASQIASASAASFLCA